MTFSSTLRFGLAAPILFLGLCPGTGHAQGATPQGEGLLKVEVLESAKAGGMIKVIVKGEDSHERSHRGKRIELIVEARVDSDAWATRLTSLDLDARELALDDVVRTARKDMSLRYALQAWSLDPNHTDLAWSARMALRELVRAEQPLKLAWVPRQGKRVPVMFQLHEPEAEGHGAHGARADARLRDLQLTGEIPLSDHSLLSLSSRRVLGIPRESHSPAIRQGRFDLKLQPEGVTLVFSESLNGEVRQRTYAAATIEQLLQMYPDLRGKVPALSHINTQQMGGAGQHVAGVFKISPAKPAVPTGFQFRVGSPTEPNRLLGVKCTTLTVSEAERRLLGPGVGLLIEGRVPGSIAESLDLQRGDILVELLGQQLCSSAEISRVMGENTKSMITVKIIDRDGIERTRSWSPAEKPSAPAAERK